MDSRRLARQQPCRYRPRQYRAAGNDLPKCALWFLLGALFMALFVSGARAEEYPPLLVPAEWESPDYRADPLAREPRKPQGRVIPRINCERPLKFGPRYGYFPPVEAVLASLRQVEIE